jgi:hypothetical protein
MLEGKVLLSMTYPYKNRLGRACNRSGFAFHSHTYAAFGAFRFPSRPVFTVSRALW